MTCSGNSKCRACSVACRQEKMNKTNENLLNLPSGLRALQLQVLMVSWHGTCTCGVSVHCRDFPAKSIRIYQNVNVSCWNITGHEDVVELPVSFPCFEIRSRASWHTAVR